jgi:hypothetical protein
VFREIGSRSGESRALAVLGDVSVQEGACRQAVDWQRQSLDICRAIGDRTGRGDRAERAR